MNNCLKQLPNPKDIDHPLFKHPLIWHFWEYCLRKVELADCQKLVNKKKIDLKKGMFMLINKNVPNDTGLTYYQYKHALKILIKNKLIAREVTAKHFAVFSIPNFNSYINCSSENISENISEKINDIPYKNILSFLNEHCDKQFTPNNEQSKRFIRARWNEGYREKDFQTVILNKASVWKNNYEMNTYLRPQTLFGNKFASYLQEKNLRTRSEAIQKSFFEED
jgi:uncharacterized phage protein (TIGR02220 family)